MCRTQTLASSLLSPVSNHLWRQRSNRHHSSPCLLEPYLHVFDKDGPGCPASMVLGDQTSKEGIRNALRVHFWILSFLLQVWFKTMSAKRTIFECKSVCKGRFLRKVGPVFSRDQWHVGAQNGELSKAANPSKAYIWRLSVEKYTLQAQLPEGIGATWELLSGPQHSEACY